MSVEDQGAIAVVDTLTHALVATWLQMAPASWVAPVDKLSLPFTILLAGLWLRESLTWQVGAGVTLMVLGALLTRA